MLDLFVIISLVVCLAQFIKGIGLVKPKHFCWVTIAIGVAISVAYGGDNLKTVIATGVGSGLCANVLCLAVKFMG